MSSEKFENNQNLETEFILDDLLQNGFTTIPNTIFHEKISYKAIGLYASIIRRKNIPGWKVYQSALITEMDGKTSIASAIKELINAGFIIKELTRNDKGHITGVRYKIFASKQIQPKSENLISDNQPKSENPKSVFPISDNQPLEKKDNNKIKNIKNKDKKEYKEKKNDEEIIKKIVKIYPGTKTKSVRDKKLPKIIKEHGAEEILEAVTRYAKTVEGKEKQFILNESTFWNGRYIDYLTENYEEEPKVGGTSRKYKVNVEDKSKKEAGKFNNFEPRKYSDADYKYLEERCCPAIKEEDYEVKDEDVCFGGFNLNEIENTY